MPETRAVPTPARRVKRRVSARRSAFGAGRMKSSERRLSSAVA